MILTTLTGEFYKGQRSLSLALESVLDGIHAAVEACPTVPRILNPVHSDENFADSWDQERYDKFRAYIRNFRGTLKATLNPSLAEQRRGLDGTTEHLGKMFGAERVKEAIRLEAKDLNERRTAGRLSMASGGLLTTYSTPRSVPVTSNHFYGR